MAPRLGRLEFNPLPSQPRGWVIGAAPQLDAHWMLSHGGHHVARLVLTFDDDEGARDEIGVWLDATSRSPSDESGVITDYMVRQLQDLRVSAELSVADVKGQPELLVWMHSVVKGRTAQLPDEFVGVGHDVLLLPRRECCPGRHALLWESCIGAGITIENPRSLTW